jgi:polysaccharide pyruvyl transferase WcaK-like protein
MGLIRSLARGAAKAALDGTKRALDPDVILGSAMSALIEARASEHRTSPERPYRVGDPLRLLFAGYVGSRNTGADVRVEEMLRQFRHLFGDDHVDLSVLTIDPAWTRGYFKTVRQIEVPQVFPKFLFDEVRRHDGVVACEGSMFKSKFANALTTMMVGSLGLALAEDKIAIGYGGEAGAMDPSMEALVRKHVPGALIVARNPESMIVLDKLGIASREGTDTAWTFGGAPIALGEKLLTRAGWDGRTPVVVVCPIHPFWWPVRPDPVKAAVHAATGAHEHTHFRSMYFHHDGPEVEAQLRTYLSRFAGALKDLSRKRKIFPVVVGMEALDRRAVERFVEVYGPGPSGTPLPTFVSDEHDMFELVALLRASSLVVSSRYHAIVCSMPGGVPSIGVTMDERIRNLMRDRGQPELSLECDDPALDEKLLGAMERVLAEPDRIRLGIATSVTESLLRMGRMGAYVVQHVREKHPRFRFRPGLGDESRPELHLPPLPEAQARLLEHGVLAQVGGTSIEASS